MRKSPKPGPMPPTTVEGGGSRGPCGSLAATCRCGLSQSVAPGAVPSGSPGWGSLCLAQWSGEARRISDFSGSSARLQPGLTRPCPTAPELRVCSAPARPAMGAPCRSLSAILLLLQVLGMSRLPAGRLPAPPPASLCLSACCPPAFLLPRKLGSRGSDLPGGCAARS